mmetsp:Transcript_89349/g.158520  ORF Transcript_89349/g.158520 Transcript_89349/m.158520 type:complete len:902 (-) Transcript_89349:76-2781(-)
MKCGICCQALLLAATAAYKIGSDADLTLEVISKKEIASSTSSQELSQRDEVQLLTSLAHSIAQTEALEVSQRLSQEILPREAFEGKPASVPASRQQLYFRPVSTTLYCVMVLTVQSMIVYTALAIARNVDELSGEMKVSKITDTLTAASRSTVYSSMLSMLFVACRMYVLATTQGLGEPPLWVKGCMVAATLGMTLQILLVLAMPLFTRESKSANAKAFSDLAGDTNDVHPKIAPHVFHTAIGKQTAWASQIATMFTVYGGTAGVLVGVVIFPAQSTKISAAVQCTCWLSVLYFSVYLILWCARTNRDYAQERYARRAEKIEASALAMSQVVRKAPMFAVVFLAARMRALQLDPPYGMPPPWAQLCLYGMTGALYLETISAAYVGATGTEAVGYYGIHVYRAKPIAHAVQHTFALLVYAGLVPVTAVIMIMKAHDGTTAPLSPMMKSVLLFSVLYFGVHIGQWISAFFQDICKKHFKVMQDTLLAAGVSITFVPVLCILFVACRMRALQITQQMGSPQGWAEDCMYLCVFATYVQVIACLLLPIFTNAATEVDADGNASYDLRPMVGAYAVTVVKYVALLSLHGGVLAICVAVFTMTPDTAHAGNKGRFDLWQLAQMVCVTMLITLLALSLSSAKVIGMAIKLGIESADEPLLGTNIWVGRAALSVCDGYVNVGGLVVDNPPAQAGKQWKSSCLMKVDKLIVKINIWRLVKSLGKEFQITAIVLEGLQLTIEKSYGTDSNVKQVLAHMEAQKEQDDAAKKVQALASAPSDSANPDAILPSPDVIVNLVSIRDIGASAILQGTPFTIQVGDLYFEDFNKKLKREGGSAHVAGDVVVAIMMTILKSIMAKSPLLGAGVKSARDAVHGAAQKLIDYVSVPKGKERQGNAAGEMVKAASPRAANS